MLSRLMLQTRQLGLSMHLSAAIGNPGSTPMFNTFIAPGNIPVSSNSAERYMPWPAYNVIGQAYLNNSGTNNANYYWNFTFPAPQRVPGVYRVQSEVPGGGGGAGTFGRFGEAGGSGASADDTVFLNSFLGTASTTLSIPRVGYRANTTEGTPNDPIDTIAYGARPFNFPAGAGITSLSNTVGGRNGASTSYNPTPTGNGGQGGNFSTDHRGTDGTGGYVTVTLMR